MKKYRSHTILHVLNRQFLIDRNIYEKKNRNPIRKKNNSGNSSKFYFYSIQQVDVCWSVYTPESSYINYLMQQLVIVCNFVVILFCVDRKKNFNFRNSLFFLSLSLSSINPCQQVSSPHGSVRNRWNAFNENKILLKKQQNFKSTGCQHCLSFFRLTVLE